MIYHQDEDCLLDDLTPNMENILNTFNEQIDTHSLKYFDWSNKVINKNIRKKRLTNHYVDFRFSNLRQKIK